MAANGGMEESIETLDWLGQPVRCCGVPMKRCVGTASARKATPVYAIAG